jgi:hypothetical protein
LEPAKFPLEKVQRRAEENCGMETPATTPETTTMAIAREAARLAFLCADLGGASLGESEPEWATHFDSPFEQEKAELLAGIREEVRKGGMSQHADLLLDVCRDVLLHLAGAVSGADSNVGAFDAPRREGAALGISVQ